MRRELDAERLNAGEEVVAERAGEDEDDVGPDPEDVARRLEEPHAPRVGGQDELRLGLDPALAGQLLRRGAAVCFGGRRLCAFGRKRVAAAARRLRQPDDEPGEHKGRQGQDHERRPPRQGGDVAGDREADARAEELAGEDEAVDPAALGRGEVVADERGDERPGGRGHGAEREPRQQELAEVGHGRAPDHRDAPEHDRQAEEPGSAHAVREDSEREAGRGGDERRDRDEQADVRVVDVQGVAKLGCRGADGGGIGAAESQHRCEQDNDPSALRSAERPLERTRAAACEPADRGAGGGRRPFCRAAAGLHAGPNVPRSKD